MLRSFTMCRLETINLMIDSLIEPIDVIAYSSVIQTLDFDLMCYLFHTLRIYNLANFVI
jgi:hypothetical protein